MTWSELSQLTPDQISNYSDMCYCISIACVKLSILLLINRIFLSVNRNVFFWLTQFLIWVNSLFYAIAVFLTIFACRPRKKIWNPDLPGKCLNSKSLYITSASFNTASGRNFLASRCLTLLLSYSERRTGVTFRSDDNADSVAEFRHCHAFRATLSDLVFTDQLSAQSGDISRLWDWGIVRSSSAVGHDKSANV